MNQRQIEDNQRLWESRLNAHSRYVLNDVVSLIEEVRIRSQLANLWLTKALRLLVS